MIKIKTNLNINNMSLRQLEAVARLHNIVQSLSDNSSNIEVEEQDLFINLGIIFKVHKNTIETQPFDNLIILITKWEEIFKAFNGKLPNIMLNRNKFLLRKYSQADILLEKKIINYSRNVFSRVKGFFRLRRMRKSDIYSVINDINSLLSGYWIYYMDKLSIKIAEAKYEHEKWEYIADLLSIVAWENESDQSIFIGHNELLNEDAVLDKKERILDLNAMEALELYYSFEKKNKNIFKVD